MLVSLHDVTVGEPDRDLVLSGFEVSIGDVRHGDVDRPFGHGSRPGVDFLESGTITMTLRSAPGIRDRAGADRVSSAFLRAWRASLSTPAGVLSPLLVEAGGRRRLVYGRAGRISPPATDSVLKRQGLVEIIAEFRVLDPLVYDVSPVGATLSVIPRSLGGIITPLVTPITTTMTSGVEYRMLTVPGDAPAPLRVTFHAPARDPRVVVGGVEVGLTGQQAWDEDVIVDGRARTVTFPDGTAAAHRLSRASRLDLLRVEPGTHEISFSATDRTGTARVTVEATPTYFHL